MRRVLILGALTLAGCDPEMAPTARGSGGSNLVQITDKVWRVHDTEARVTCWFLQPIPGVQGGSGAISCIPDHDYTGRVP